MSDVRDTIHVNVEYFDGQEDEGVGYPYYVASCVEITATTDGETLDELIQNVREMIELYLEDTDTIAAFNLVPSPRIIVIMELPENYAKTA
ncbi:MAG: type II toxin-antitoxin system HicB family antitoxin [Chloroflexota bacterium]